jgi:DNA gyrase/topoisomerase IV subunit A
LIWAVDHLDLVFAALRTNDPEEYLVKKGDIKPEAAKYIMDQQVRRLSKLEGAELREKKRESVNLVKSFKLDIKTKDSVAKRVYKQLLQD